MTKISVSTLSDDLSFGARINGVDIDNLKDLEVRQQINDVFVDRGMIVFEGVEPTNAMQVALSEVFGELEDHALKDVPMADDQIRGMTDFTYEDVFQVDGKELSGFIPWHFDACYTDVLNRGGILRALVISQEGGLTGFADGVQLYNAIDPTLRAKFENLNIIYHSHLMFMNLKFGRPAEYRPIKLRQMIADMIENTRNAPRSVHPAIWQRSTGEKVLHVSPWQAAGIEGMETPEGDALLAELISEMEAKMTPYFHTWKPTDMAIWDNWRFVHAASGNPPQFLRRMQRTTIKGDYGLGRLELAGSAKPVGVNV
jgi:taurine dioxygenase